MAVSRNRVDVMGYVGQAPELKYHESVSVLTFSVGVSERWTAPNGEKRERTEWVRCSLVDGRLPDGKASARTAFLSQALRKGSAVAVEGSLRTREYQAEDGSKRWATDVRVSDVQLLDRAPKAGES